MQKRPNIVLMVADDHGREALGCYGNPAIKTPNLDALARDGVRFDNSFCTSASCSPSRAVILTGLQNHTTGTYGLTHAKNHFSCFDGIRTLPAMLRQGGYRTGRAGKKHYAPESLFPFDFNAADADRDDVRMSENCREFVRGAEPFFLYWCSKNPHRKAALKNHPLRPDNFGNPEKSFAGDQELEYDPAEVIVPSFLNDTPAARAELAQYYQSISRLDRGVGRLVDVLREAGKYENTVLIYVSDNGAAFPQAKTTLYDPGMRLPCIVRSPLHQTRGGVCAGLVTWADLTPTILEFAGLHENPEQFFGQSFARIIDVENPADWRGEIYAAHSFHGITGYYPMRAVRTRRHKFIWNIAWKLDYPFASDLWNAASWQAALRAGTAQCGARPVENYLRRPRFELYDLENDPDEINNLAGLSGSQALVEDFIVKIKQFQADTDDPWLHKWTYE